MSQMAPEAPPAAPAPPPSRGRAGGGNVFTRKIGPLPMWVWLLIGVALIGAYIVWKRNQSGQQAATANASQVPQFVNQTYVSGVPPTVGQPAPTPQCPPGYAWDPDANKGKGKCVKEHSGRPKRRKHKGREAPATAPTSGTSVTSINPGTGLPPTFFPQYVPPAGGPTGPAVGPGMAA